MFFVALWCFKKPTLKALARSGRVQQSRSSWIRTGQRDLESSNWGFTPEKKALGFGDSWYFLWSVQLGGFLDLEGPFGLS